MENIDFEKLRQDLLDYYGAAMHSGFPMAMMDVIDIESATDEDLIKIALRSGFNLNDYETYRRK